MPPVDLVVYGGTPSGIMACIAAARRGLSTALVCGSNPLGGMMSNGLSATDGGATDLRGLPRQYFDLLTQYYNNLNHANEWLIMRSEPRIARILFFNMLRDAGTVIYDSKMSGQLPTSVLSDVKTDGRNIVAIRLTTGEILRAKVFIDCSYEQDLMMRTCRYIIGRESDLRYGETYAGFNSFVVNGVPNTLSNTPARDSSGNLKPYVFPFPRGVRDGGADAAVQPYTFRLALCKKKMSSDNQVAYPENVLPFSSWKEPASYNPDLIHAILSAAPALFKPAYCQNGVYDLNGDFNSRISWAYPGGNADTRAKIIAQHKTYQQHLLYYWTNDPRSSYREEIQDLGWGLPKNEFTLNEHWPQQIYIRGAARLVNKYVVTQKNFLTDPHINPVPHPVGVGRYPFDLHAVQMIEDPPTGKINREGSIIPDKDHPYTQTVPYQLPYEMMLPDEWDNFLVAGLGPAVSHVAHSSYRIELTMMVLGQAAGTAAAMAIKDRSILSDWNLRSGIGGELNSKESNYVVLMPTVVTTQSSVAYSESLDSA
jgi:hypothetical protein